METYCNKKISDFDFCVRFILDMDIESGSEDSYCYDKNHILSRQKHITSE
jgi:hypothetical protein